MTLLRHLHACAARFVRGVGDFSLVFSQLVLGTSLILSTTAPLKAADFTIQNGQTEINQVITLSFGETGTILQGGTIVDDDFAITAHRDTTIDNAGTLTSVTNSGVINVVGEFILFNRATGTITGGGGDGVEAELVTSLINSGTIIGSDDGVDAFVFYSLINSGTITGGDNGVEARILLSSLINSGTITGGDDGVDAVRIVSLTNSGKITGGDHAIIETGSADTLLTLLPGSDIFGAIDLGGGTNGLVIGNGLSINHVFTALPDVINSNGAPLFISGNRVVVVNPASFAQQDEMLFDLSNGIWGTVFNQLGNSRFDQGSSTYASSLLSFDSDPSAETTFNDDGYHVWANAFGNRRNQDGDISVNARHTLGGFILGLDGQYNSDIRLGAFFGASQTDIDTLSNQQSNVESIFGGLYASFNADSYTIKLGVTGGTTSHDNTKLVDNNQINGLETVNSRFDGAFIAPELSIGSQYDMGTAGILLPTLRIGYAGLFLESYTETGTSAPLSVADRDLHLLHARFELAAQKTITKGEDSPNFILTPYVGIEGRSLVGGEAVNVTLLGQNLSFTPGGSENIANAFAGMRFSMMQTENLSIFAGIEGGFDTDDSSSVTGNFGLKWVF